MIRTKESYNPKFLPASKIFSEFGVPRSLLRSLAVNGRVKCIEKSLPDCEHLMKLYSVKDVTRYLNEG